MSVHELLPRLPEPSELLRRSRTFAVLDAIMTDQFPTYTFQPRFAPGVSVGFLDNGSGDHHALVFDAAGVFGFGFDHECEATPWREEPRRHWPGLLTGLPDSFAGYLEEPAFRFNDFFDATVCFWRERRDPDWRCGPVEFEQFESDGAGWLFDALTGEPVESYVKYASDYFECEVDPAVVARVFAGEPVTAAIVAALAPKRAVTEALAEVAATGHPVAR